jgi:uncharacterized membrane protein YdfJ with MMPL/SSD domain
MEIISSAEEQMSKITIEISMQKDELSRAETTEPRRFSRIRSTIADKIKVSTIEVTKVAETTESESKRAKTRKATSTKKKLCRIKETTRNATSNTRKS